MDCLGQVVWGPHTDTRIPGGRGVEVSPELVQDSCERWVARNYGEVYEMSMGSEAYGAWSRPEDLLVPG